MDGIPTGGPGNGALRGGPSWPQTSLQPPLLSSPTQPSPPSPPPPPSPPEGHTSSLHHLVELALDVQLGVLCFHTFELDGNFFTRSDVGTCRGMGSKGQGPPRGAGGSTPAPTVPVPVAAPEWPAQCPWGGRGLSTVSEGSGGSCGAQRGTRASLGGAGSITTVAPGKGWGMRADSENHGPCCRVQVQGGTGGATKGSQTTT